MIETPTVEKILGDAECLYNTYFDTYNHIEKYVKKYEIEVSNSTIVLNLIMNESYQVVLENLIAKNLNAADNYIQKVCTEFVAIQKLALSEIAHIKAKEIEYQINNPAFFRTIRKEYRILSNELNDLDNEAKKIVDLDKFELKIENIITNLKNIEYDIIEEKNSGLYRAILNAGVWGIPILISFYQLIAMQYIAMNPYLPLIFYVIALFAVYCLLKSVIHIKLLYSSLKADKFKNSFSIFILFGTIYISSSLINMYNAGFEFNADTYGRFTIFLLFLMIVILVAKEKIGKIKKKSIIKEFRDLELIYGIEENRELKRFFSSIESFVNI